MSEYTKHPWSMHISKTQITIQGPNNQTVAIMPYGLTVSAAETRANADLIVRADQMLRLLEESQKFIGGDWRERRDNLIEEIRGKR